MKVRDTSPGRLYALSSEIGCVAINGAMAVDIPAGGQVVVLALDKKIVIDGDDAAKFVEVRWGTNTVVGSRPVPAWLSGVLAGLVYIVGEANFDINYIPAENKLYLQFSLEVTTEQIDEVQQLLERVLPKDLEIEMQWADGLPMSYTRLEYLESTGTQYILTGLTSNTLSCSCDFKPVSAPTAQNIVVGCENSRHNQYYRICISKNNIGIGLEVGVKNGDKGILNAIGSFDNPPLSPVSGVIDFDNLKISQRTSAGYKEANINPEVEDGMETMYVALFARGTNLINISDGYFAKVQMFNFKASRAQQALANYIPALDPITKQPGMYDTVNKVFKTNAGTGDFTYPGKETEATTYSLRNRMYGKITEHGIRRLYCVPEGYNSKEEYAEANGFKLIVEPPMPEEGYWAPVWHDREDCIELEWVETEPPTAELQIEDTENA